MIALPKKDLPHFWGHHTPFPKILTAWVIGWKGNPLGTKWTETSSPTEL